MTLLLWVAAGLGVFGLVCLWLAVVDLCKMGRER